MGRNKIYTKLGDKGLTSLGNGKRVYKNSARVNAYGTVDELNSVHSMLMNFKECEKYKDILADIQHVLFKIQTALSLGTNNISISGKEDPVILLEQQIDLMNESLPVLKNFILPGGSELLSWIDIARTVCRRAERVIFSLSEQEPVEQNIFCYVNRLSDYYFVFARKIGADCLIAERKVN